LIETILAMQQVIVINWIGGQGKCPNKFF